MLHQLQILKLSDDIWDMEGKNEQSVSRQYYEKLAEWAERFALLVFGFLVIKGFAEGQSVLIVGMGVIAATLAYTFAYKKLQHLK